MNIASAQMLQDSLNRLGDAFYHNRALAQQRQEEQERNGIDQAFREAQLEHYSQLEQKADEQTQRIDSHNRLMEQKADDQTQKMEQRFKLQQAFKDLTEAKDSLTSGMQGLALDKSLDNDDKTAYLQESVDSLPDEIKSGVLQSPQIRALYDGSGDWDAVAQAVAASKSQKAPASVQNEQTADSYDAKAKDLQTQADAATDDASKADLQAQADSATAAASRLRAVNQKATQFAPHPNVDKTWDLDKSGHRTGEHTIYSAPPPPAASGAPAQSADNGGYIITPGSLADQLRQAGALQPTGGIPALAPDTGSVQVNATGTPTGRPAAPAYNSPADVRADYQAGRITKAQASQILQSQFGMQ